MNEIIKLLIDNKNDEKLEQALISSYNAKNSLPLHLVPHRFRNKGFFYNECLRKHQYDLVPNQSSEEIQTLKKDLLEKSNELNRVDASAFNIKRVKADIYYLRAYLFQLMNDSFGLSESCRDNFKTLNRKIEELSENEIFEILEIEIDNRGVPINDSYGLEFYHFNYESFTDRNDFANYPELFTNLLQISFDQGGLVVFQLYGVQIYKLFNAKGKLITGPCHDLDILINGKYIERDSGNISGFHLSKYSLLTDSVFHIKSLSDLDIFEFLTIYSRDRLQIEIGKSVPERIENFIEPRSKNEAKLILLDANCNWITSPELSKFYENDKELALLAVSKEPLAYSLLSNDLMLDKSIQEVLCKTTNRNLLHYIKEWNLDVEHLLTLDELCELIKNNENLLSVLSNNIHSNVECLFAAISNDSSNIKYVDGSHKEYRRLALAAVKSDGKALEYICDSFKSDKQIVLAAVKNYGGALKYASVSVKSDREIVLVAVQNDGNSLKYASASLQNDMEVVLLAVNKFGESLEFASSSLKENKEVVLEAIKSRYHAFQYCSEFLRTDVDFICEAFKINLQIMGYIDTEIINQYQSLKELYCEYKSRHEDDDLPF